MPMRISVIGGGYAGLVSSICFAELGHLVSLVEIDPEKVETNIVVIETPGISAARAVSVLGSLGIGCLTLSPTSLRIVTHLSLTERDVRFAAASLAAFGG